MFYVCLHTHCSWMNKSSFQDLNPFHKLPAKTLIFITFILFFLNVQWISLGMQAEFCNFLTNSVSMSALIQGRA